MLKEDKQSLIAYRIEMSKQAINDAEFLINHDKLRIAVNRIYYAIFYILSALALEHNFSTSKHLPLIGWFNKNFIKAGLVQKKYSNIVYLAYDKRSKGDYDDFVVFEKEEVLSLYNDMKDFVSTIETLISSSR